LRGYILVEWRLFLAGVVVLYQACFFPTGHRNCTRPGLFRACSQRCWRHQLRSVLSVIYFLFACYLFLHSVRSIPSPWSFFLRCSPPPPLPPLPTSPPSPTHFYTFLYLFTILYTKYLYLHFIFISFISFLHSFFLFFLF